MIKLIFIFFLLFFNKVFTQRIPCYDLDQILKVEPTALYKPHLEASKAFRIKILKSSGTIQQYINRGKLKSVPKKSKGYRVQNLEYSRPFLTGKAKTVLEKMGVRFAKESSGHYFTVSSITRTLDDQCRLRKVNPNASLGISSHNYGNSFDISYVRFDGKLKYTPKLEKILGEVMEHYRKLGRILYIKEKQQACYHITVLNY